MSFYWEREMKRMSFTIGEMAKYLNIPPSALRYYEREGLLPFVERSAGGARFFKDSDVEWLHLIDCMKKTGMPIKDIKTFVNLCIEGDSTIQQRLTLLEKQRDSVLARIAELQETLNTLDYKHWYYEQAKAAGTCQGLENLTEEDVPEELLPAFRKLKSI